MSGMQVHQGQILERAIRRNGYSISEVARLAKVNRRSVYNWFKQDQLRPEIICKIGLALRYDFSKEFPELFDDKQATQEDKKSPLYIEHLAPTPSTSTTHDIIYWKDKYIDLLEKHNKLLLFMFQK